MIFLTELITSRWFIKLQLPIWQVVEVAQKPKKIVLQLVVVEKNHGSKKELVVQELEHHVAPFGEVVE